MIPGPFHLKVSKEAVRLNYAALPADIKAKLVGFVAFDPAKHDLYQISLSVVQDLLGREVKPGEKIPRKMKKPSYDRADEIYVYCRPGSEEIQLLGVLPESQTLDGKQTTLELSPDVNFGIGPWKAAFKAAFKTDLTHRPIGVASGRTPDLAQWIFFKPWMQGKMSFDLEVFCAIPKNLSATQRFLLFDAAALEGTRFLDVAKRKKVAIPAAEPAVAQVVAAPSQVPAQVPALTPVASPAPAAAGVA